MQVRPSTPFPDLSEPLFPHLSKGIIVPALLGRSRNSQMFPLGGFSSEQSPGVRGKGELEMAP